VPQLVAKLPELEAPELEAPELEALELEPPPDEDPLEVPLSPIGPVPFELAQPSVTNTERTRSAPREAIQ
jgi:hypothetical protein